MRENGRALAVSPIISVLTQQKTNTKESGFVLELQAVVSLTRIIRHWRTDSVRTEGTLLCHQKKKRCIMWQTEQSFSLYRLIHLWKSVNELIKSEVCFRPSFDSCFAVKELLSVMLTTQLKEMCPTLAASSCCWKPEWVPGARVKHQVIQCHSSRRPVKRRH